MSGWPLFRAASLTWGRRDADARINAFTIDQSPAPVLDGRS
jgi:hypothetical protein